LTQKNRLETANSSLIIWIWAGVIFGGGGAIAPLSSWALATLTTFGIKSTFTGK